MLNRCTSWPFFFLLCKQCLFVFLWWIQIFWQFEVAKNLLIACRNVTRIDHYSVCELPVIILNGCRYNASKHLHWEKKKPFGCWAINREYLWCLFLCVSGKKDATLLTDRMKLLNATWAQGGLWLNSETFITNSNRWTRIIYNKINWAFTPLLASLSLDLV